MLPKTTFTLEDRKCLAPHLTEPWYRRREPMPMDEFPPITLYSKQLPRGLFECVEEKVIMLTKENLEQLEFYKVSVRLCKNGELHFILTGKRPSFAKKLYDKLKALNPEEIYGDNE